MRDRILSWDGSVNARDLGGLPLRDGGTTRSGRVVRSEDPALLTAQGWSALADYGVRTTLDLRFVEERTEHPPHAADVDVAHVPLFGRIDRSELERIDGLIVAAADAAAALHLMYRNALETQADRVVAALDVVASASERGAVLVHCAIGKDRTGIVSAFLLQLAGVEAGAVADDYALSHDRIGPLIDGWIDGAGTDAERARRQRLSAAPRGAMLRLLDDLERDFGGPAAYLREAGLDERTIGRLADVLR